MDKNFVWVMFSSKADKMVEIFGNPYDAFNRCINLLIELNDENNWYDKSWLVEDVTTLCELFNEDMDNFGIEGCFEVWKEKIQ